jgi:flagellar motor switch protein FliN/FliY
VEVAQPEIFAKIISNEDLQFILNDDSLDSYFVKTSFHFTIGSLVDSKIVQFLGRPFAINIFESMISKTGLKNEDDITGDNMDPEDLNKDISMDALSASQSRTADILLNMGAGMESRKNTDENTENGKKNLAEKNSRNNLNVNTTANTNNSPDDRNVQNHHDENIVQFPAEKSRNIDMLMAVPMDITVELGRIEKPIKDILNMGPGSILELDKFKGDRVDIMVNGKKIAIGEVVVVDNSYGVRITDIVKSKDRF